MMSQTYPRSCGWRIRSVRSDSRDRKEDGSPEPSSFFPWACFDETARLGAALCRPEPRSASVIATHGLLRQFDRRVVVGAILDDPPPLLRGHAIQFAADLLDRAALQQ